MSSLHKIRAGWTSLRRHRADGELDEELRFHLEAQTEENMERGMTRAEAERAARMQLGGVQQTMEACREVRLLSKVEWLAQDARFGFRLLAREKGFTAVAVLTLAVGIGMNLAAFNVLNAEIFRPLPVRDPETLVRLTRQGPASYASSVAYPAVEFLKRNNSVLSAVLAVRSDQLPVDDNLAQPARLEFVTPNYFSELGVGAAYGRTFDEKGDGAAGAAPVAVVSYAFWQRHFGSDVAAIGKTIRVNLKPATVIGVAAYDFFGLGSRSVDAWLLLPQHGYFVTGSQVLTDAAGANMYARVKSDISLKSAEDALAPVSVEVRKAYPKAMNEGERLMVSPAGYMGEGGRMQAEQLAVIAVIATLFGLILITACANLGNLLLARAVTREREMAIRAWVGASRGRIVFQLLTESLVLALAGTAAGAGFAAIALRVMQNTLAMPPQFAFHLDYRVFLFSLGIALAACILFGLTPALEAVRHGHRKHRVRRIMIGVQVAASCVLLIVSALLVRSLDRALYGELGFEYKNVLAIDPGLSAHGFDTASSSAYFEELRARLTALPGVSNVALTTIPPLGDRVAITYFAAAQTVPVYISQVEPQFFAAMKIPILRGRNFQPGEQKVTIVGETFARKLWPGQDPLGKQAPNERTVIGIAGTARTVAIQDGSATELYVPLDARSELLPTAVALVRTSAPPEALAEQVRGIALGIDPRVVPAMELMSDSFQRRIQPSRDMALVLSSLGLLAALLSAIGVFGMVAYAVSQRQKEIGIRMALGAEAANVLKLVMRQFAAPLAVGSLAGIALAAGISVALRSMLYGLSNLDPVSYALAIFLFVAITGAAALIPARRALRVDPAVVLRHE